MKFLKALLVFFLFGILQISAQETDTVYRSNEIINHEGEKYFLHLVEKGQTLYSISRAYGVSIEDILNENPEAGDALDIGMELMIPLPESPESRLGEDFDFFYHVSKSNESFREISEIYSVDEEIIREANPDFEEPLKEGRYIKVPVNMGISKTENLSPGKGGPDLSQNYLDHVVRKGETLYGISKEYRVEIEDILKMNPRLGTRLEIGRVIRIPREEKYPDKPRPSEVRKKDGLIMHEVKACENFYKIAREYGVSPDTLRAYNPSSGGRLRIGQLIRIPVGKTGDHFIIHKVRENKESLNEIARSYGISEDDIMAFNPGLDDPVYKGQILRIPITDENTDDRITGDNRDFTRQMASSSLSDSIYCLADIEGTKNEPYQIALFIPLYLQSLDTILRDEDPDNRTLQRAIRFLKFYEGFMLAADTLEKQGMALEISVFDLSTDIDETLALLRKPEMRKMDLMVGPFFSRSFYYVSAFAEAYGINIINPFTNRKEVLDGRSKVFKAQPSRETLPGQLLSYVDYYYPGAKIIIVRDNPYQYKEELDTLKEIFSGFYNRTVMVPNTIIYNTLVRRSMEKIEDYEGEGDMLESIMIENELVLKKEIESAFEDSTSIPDYVSDIVYMEDSIRGLSKAASIVRQNVIIALSEEKAFILDLLANLNVLRDSMDFRVIGLPDWHDLADFEPELFLNLNVQIVSPLLVDYESELTKWFVHKYRQNYFEEPGMISFQGFDLGYYFLSALDRFGRDFAACLEFHRPGLTQNDFVFERASPVDGYENIYWYFYNFRNYTLNKQLNPYILKQEHQKHPGLSHAHQYIH